MFTKNEIKTKKVYKVTVEHLSTGIILNIFVQAFNSNDAGIAVLADLGNDYDLLKSISTRPNDLN